jgi:hypothetical protein
MQGALYKNKTDIRMSFDWGGRAILQSAKHKRQQFESKIVPGCQLT